MTELRVWAPKATRLEAVIGDRRIEMVREPDGWWSGPPVTVGTDYAFSIDGGKPLPDPRSRWQPAGVHGPSRATDLDTPPPFSPVPLRDAVIYELHVGTFSEAGTFDGAVAHLDHLVSLGVTHVELLPIAQFSGRHGWGYDGVGLFAAHDAYGGPQGLRRLIDACHARGLAVLIDVVHNHLGPEGAYAPSFGPYFTPAHRTPWGEGINLDQEGSAEVRRFLIDSALAWLRDHGADGLRLDAIDALVDASPVHFVAQLTDEVRALERDLGRSFALIGEWDAHDPLPVVDRADGGWGLDAHWNEDLHRAVHAMLVRDRSGYYADFAAPGTLAKVLTHGYALDGGDYAFRGPRHGRPYGDLPRHRLVGHIQTHDRVGNRAVGERFHQLCGLPRARIAAAILLSSPFVPMLFMGEEWAASTPFQFFAQPESAELGRAIREGRRREHAHDPGARSESGPLHLGPGWEQAPDPTDPATRDRCVLRWDERDRGEHAEMLAWYQHLIALRRSTPALREAPISVDERADALVIRRGAVTVRVDLTADTVTLEAT